MDVDDLVWQTNTRRGLSPRRVTLLLERGHLDLVAQAAVERGEWFCAEAAVEALCRSGDFERALSVMEPFAATGWRAALYAKAEILLRAGRRTEEALPLIRPDEAGGLSTGECHAVAEMLGKAGRVDEAVELLVPRLDESSSLLSVLVGITEGQGRDEWVLDLIAPRADRARRARGGEDRDHAFCGARELQARVLERAGRADEAIRILGADMPGHRFLAPTALAVYGGLLTRHGRLEDLRELIADQDPHAALGIYASALWRHGRAEEAEAVMRSAIADDDWVGYRAWLSSMFLTEGRLDDAIAVARPGFGWNDCSNLLTPLAHLLLDRLDRPEELLRLVEHPSVVPYHDHEEFQHWWRAWALARLGRVDEAIAATEADPRPWADPRIVKADLLRMVGRLDTAADELRALGTIRAREELCEILILQGRAAEAIAVHPTVTELRAAEPKPAPRGENGYSSEPPF
ncbi:hypothetical protein [Streptomyces pseudogriseolus]|uniref:hypothetical protein n=1 Tax=Streptomyces pseudogriseolus TaxID=36817 RepID=UPI003FA2FD76